MVEWVWRRMSREEGVERGQLTGVPGRPARLLSLRPSQNRSET